MNAPQIIPTELDKLKQEVLMLSNVVAGLAAERDDLKFHICREIQADYNRKIGKYEYQLFEYNLEMRRLKRIVERLQAAVNRKETISYQKAEADINKEFAEYTEDLKRKADKIKDDENYSRRRTDRDRSNRRAAGFGPDEEFSDRQANDEEREYDERDGDHKSDKGRMYPDEELKRLYRKIVKRLHPDMNPNATKEELNLLNKAMKAYSEGELETLREIAARLDSGEGEVKTVDAYEELLKTKEYLTRLSNLILEEIKKIKSEFPYTAKNMLKDKDAVKAKVDEIKVAIRERKKSITVLKKRIDELNDKLGNSIGE